MLNTIPLVHRRVLRFTGADVGSFLNGQTTLSAKLFNTPSSVAHYGAFLRPQGKVISDALFVVLEPGHVLCHIAADSFDEVLQRLSMVRLRAQVTIEAPALFVHTHLGSGPAHPAHFPDSRLAILESETLVFWSFDPEKHESSSDLWTAFRYQNGFGEFGNELQADQLYANEANLDLLGGIDFHKGCYVGQELTSRMKHRDAIKNRLITVSFEHAPENENRDAPVEILSNEHRVGRLLGSISTASGNLGLALLRLDRLDEIMNFSNGMPVKSQPAAWLLPHIRTSIEDA